MLGRLGALVPVPRYQRGHAVGQQRRPAFAQERVHQPGIVREVRAKLGQRVVPLTEPEPQHRRSSPGGTVRPPGSLRKLTGPPERQLGLRPLIEVLQRERAGVEGDRAQVGLPQVVAQDEQRPVNVAERGGMIAPD